jgi:UDP-glucose 4-epimerase
MDEMDLGGSKLVLVGGAGLIGSHTVDRLLEEPVREIVIVGGRESAANLRHVRGDPRVRFFTAGADVTRPDMLDAAFDGADGVFHFAALWLLQCQQFPRSAFEVNVAGTFNVLEACTRRKVKRLVFSSSAAVYGEEFPGGPEDEPRLASKNFYGASKIASEAMLTAWHHRYGLDYVSLRYLNAYGPRQEYRSAFMPVIMKMLDSIERGEGPTILGDGSQAIDFIAAEDCALANVRAMQAEATNRSYDICTGRRTTLRELAELLLDLTGSDLPINHAPAAGAAIGRDRIGWPERARREIGFSAEVGLREGLERLIAWREADKERRAAADGE